MSSGVQIQIQVLYSNSPYYMACQELTGVIKKVYSNPDTELWDFHIALRIAYLPECPQSQRKEVGVLLASGGDRIALFVLGSGYHG